MDNSQFGLGGVSAKSLDELAAMLRRGPGARRRADRRLRLSRALCSTRDRRNAREVVSGVATVGPQTGWRCRRVVLRAVDLTEVVGDLRAYGTRS